MTKTKLIKKNDSDGFNMNQLPLKKSEREREEFNNTAKNRFSKMLSNTINTKSLQLNTIFNKNIHLTMVVLTHMSS